MEVVMRRLERRRRDGGPSTARSRVARWSVRVILGVVVLFVVVNLGVAVVSWTMSSAVSLDRPAAVIGVDNLYLIDDHIWRGAHPSAAGYSSLAEAGVTVVVDLRAEHDAAESDPIAEAAGLEVVHLPIRDGQLPTRAQVATFVDVVNRAEAVFVHCGAGVGRTGAMAASYLVETGRASGTEALARNLAVGPPSVEQIWYAASADRPPTVVTAFSRVMDAPRRMWSWL